MHATKLFSDVLTPLCGRRYRDKLKTLDDLKRVPFIDMTYDPEWAIWLRAVGMGDFKPKRVLTFDSTMIAVEAAMEGAGVAVGPPSLFREDLASGRLFQPFPQIVDSGKAWWFVCPPASVSRPKTKAFEVADRGAERAAGALQPRHHRRRRSTLSSASGGQAKAKRSSGLARGARARRSDERACT